MKPKSGNGSGERARTRTFIEGKRSIAFAVCREQAGGCLAVAASTEGHYYVFETLSEAAEFLSRSRQAGELHIVPIFLTLPVFDRQERSVQTDCFCVCSGHEQG